MLFVLCILILLSRESNGGAIFWTNPHSQELFTFEFSVISLTSSQVICCLIEDIKHNHRKAPFLEAQECIRRGMGVELKSCDYCTVMPVNIKASRESFLFLPFGKLFNYL